MLASMDNVCHALEELLLNGTRHLSSVNEKLFMYTPK
jgi:hypothetical protein